jgi:hypothetical protein
MKTTKHINVSPLRAFIACLFALFLIAGTTACDSQQQTAEAPAVAEVAPAPAPAPALAPVVAAAPEPAPAPEPVAAPAPVVAPVGTRLLVTMDSELDSRKHGVGHMFTVTLDNNLVVNGQSLATKGTKLYGRTTKAKKGGMIAGSSEMDLQLSDIMIKDVPHPIVTSGIKAITENKAGTTAKTTGIGAAVGGIAGGKKGALTGAAVGLGLSALGGGKSINIPEGTLLEFTLESELTYMP